MVQQTLSEATASSVIELRPKGAEPNLTSAQNDPSVFDVHKYAPPGVTLNLTERAGSLFMPHVLNQFAIQAISRKTDLVIFQCLVRFSLGFHRPICKASNTFIARWTGLQTPHIRRGLKNLKTMGLIKIVDPGRASGKPTLYEVPIVAGLLLWKLEKENLSTSSEAQVGLRPESMRRVVVTEPKWSLDEDQRGPTGETDLVSKKEKEIKNKKKTLSQFDQLPLNLKTYILEIRPHQKRVEAEHHLSQLLVDYKPEEISDALSYLLKYGALETGAPVHSPINYLSFAAEQVIAESKKRRDKLLRAEQLKNQIDHQQDLDRQKRQAEESEFKAALASFESSLNEDQQNNVLDEFFKDHYGSSLVIPRNVVRRLAISDWYERRNRSGS